MHALFWLVAWSLSLVWLRLEWSGSPRYQWLFWDLFLALIPLALAVCVASAWRHHQRVLAGALLVPWILFFPNAPYLLTELIHLRIPDAAPHWLDIAMLTSVSATGVVAGAMSLERVLVLTDRRVRLPIELAVCAACGFGMYLGRYARWNSWDVLTAPYALAADLSRYLLHPTAHAQAWLISAVFAGSVFCLQRCVRSSDARATRG